MMQAKYWAREDLDRLAEAATFSDFPPIALSVIARMPPPVVQVSGPISTGGKGNLQANLAEFAKLINLLDRLGLSVFHQLPFQDLIYRFAKEWRAKGNSSYCMPILLDFYLPVFESGVISRVFFMPDWQSSFGSKWEHAQCERLGIKRIYLPADWHLDHSFAKQL